MRVNECRSRFRHLHKCICAAGIAITALLINAGNAEATSYPQRIADAWPAHNEIVTLLGGGNRIVATSLTEQSRPWLFRVAPGLKNASPVFTPNGDTKIEALVALQPQIVFTSEVFRAKDQLRGLGLNVVTLGFTTFEEMLRCVMQTGELLGPEAVLRAKQYHADFKEMLAYVTAKTRLIPKAAKPRVLHITSSTPITIDGRDTIIDAWINAAGGLNAAAHIPGNMKPVGYEQLAAMNPDIIILGSGAKSVRASLMNHPFLRSINAVRNQRIIDNPDGAFAWDRYGAESMLQVLWAAKLMHPQHFPEISMADKVRWFYKRYFDYSLTQNETMAILQALPPPVSKN